MRTRSDRDDMYVLSPQVLLCITYNLFGRSVNGIHNIDIVKICISRIMRVLATLESVELWVNVSEDSSRQLSRIPTRLSRPRLRILAINITARINACVAGDLSAEGFLTSDINGDLDSHTLYARRSIDMVCKRHWDHVLW